MWSSGPVAIKFLGFSFVAWGLYRAALEAEAIIAGLQDMEMTVEPVEHGRGDLGIAEDGSPFGEA